MLESEARSQALSFSLPSGWQELEPSPAAAWATFEQEAGFRKKTQSPGTRTWNANISAEVLPESLSQPSASVVTSYKRRRWQC